MNCKPNQLVVVVKTPPYATEFLGRIYRTNTMYVHPTGPLFWTMSEGNMVARDGTVVDGIEDKFLKPIRPVSDGDVDEMVRIAGKPFRVQVYDVAIGAKRHDESYKR